MMTLTGDWDICYILISTGYTKPINYTSQGSKTIFFDSSFCGLSLLEVCFELQIVKI